MPRRRVPRLMVLLDSNALLWVLQDNPRLSSQARDIITDGWSVGSVAVSAVTFWEIAILAERNRLALGCDPARWRSDVIADGLRECRYMAPRRFGPRSWM